MCISDNADEYNTPCLIRLLESLRKNFSTVKMKLVIHRDIKKTVRRLIDIDFFDKLNIFVICIAGTDDFSCYDDCSLHIGFRVHAHIYNLSRRNVSVLINEDMRGYGINITLGLENVFVQERIYVQKHRRLLQNLSLSLGLYRANDFSPMFMQIDRMIETIEKGDLDVYETAYMRMQKYWKNMKSYLSLVLKC